MRSKRLRIGVNAAFLGRAYVGLNTYVRGLLDAFNNNEPCAELEFFVYTSRREDVPQGPNLIWRHTPSFLCHENGTLGNAARLVWTQTFLPLMLLRDRVDLLLAPLPESPAWGRVQKTIVIHDLIPLMYPEECPRYSHIFRYVLPRMLAAASSIICVSHHTKRDLLRLCSVEDKKVSVIYNGVSDDYFETGAETRVDKCPDRFFLYVGSSIQRKNVGRVIEAFAVVRDYVPEDLVLVLPSPGQCESIYRIASTYDLQSRLHTYSRLSTSQLVFLYRHATANVLLSEYEGFGYPPAEALAAGTPSIVSLGTSLSEVVADAGLVVDSVDLSSICKAMIDLSTGSDLARSLRQKAIQSRNRFRWSAAVVRWREMLLPVTEGTELAAEPVASTVSEE